MSDLLEQLAEALNPATNAKHIRQSKIEAEIKEINQDYEVCPNCGGSPVERIGECKHCSYCDFYF